MTQARRKAAALGAKWGIAQRQEGRVLAPAVDLRVKVLLGSVKPLYRFAWTTTPQHPEVHQRRVGCEPQELHFDPYVSIPGFPLAPDP
jgi:hypothetical protein